MQNRFNRIRKVLQQNNLHGFFISSLSNIFYITGFSGFLETGDAYCLITKKKNYLFTHRLYIHEVQFFKKDFVLCEISPEKRLSTWLKEIITSERIKDIGVEEDDISLFSYQQLEKISNASWYALSLSTIRGIKEKEEIEKIKKACALTDEAFSYLLKHIAPGITEAELQYKLKTFAAEHQADNAFEPVVAFGTNTAFPHHTPNQTVLDKNDVILLDFGMKYQGYCADMSRTIFIGKVNDKTKHIYQTVISAQEMAIKKIKQLQKESKLVSAAEIDKISRKEITKNGFPDYPHALGHGIGIEVHEYPVLYPRAKENLETRMVIAIEPAIYIPKLLGIRIEDNYVITDKGIEALTKSSHELIIL